MLSAHKDGDALSSFLIMHRAQYRYGPLLGLASQQTRQEGVRVWQWNYVVIGSSVKKDELLFHAPRDGSRA